MAIAKKLTASAIASSLMLAIAGPAFAADLSVEQVADKMFDLGIIVGNGTDLNLGGTLTRAELITTIVRTFGMEQAALLAKGAPSFNDVAASEWYSGWVAVAKNLAAQKGVELGVGNNVFNPNGQLSKVEALVFVMKFLGVKPATTSAIWYESWINEAVAQGIVTEAQGADLMATADTKSTRGQAFVILDRGYSFKDANGKSLYTTHVDAQLPTLTLTPAAATDEAEITLSGSVADNKGVASVVINGEQAALTNGAFSHKLALKVGKNEVAVVVTDLAGNVLTKNYEITRNNVEAEKIEAADITIVAGATADVEAKLVDKNGAEIANAAITGTSDLGTFENGVFTAGKKAGEGKLTLKSGEITKVVNVKVEAGELAKIGSDKATVAVSGVATLTGQDQFGNVIAGVTFTQSAANGFISGNKFIATTAGNYTITATKDGKSVELTLSVYDANVTGYTITTSTNTLVANNASSFTATIQAVDANGIAINDAAVTNTLTWDANSVANFEIYNATNETWGDLSTTQLTAGKATVTLRTKATLGGVTRSLGFTGQTAKADIALVDQVATNVSVSTASKFLRNNLGSETVTFSVNVLDQDGKPMKSGVYNVALGVSGAGAKLIENAVAVDTQNVNVFGATGAVTATVRSAYLQTGTVTVNATATGLGTASATVNAVTALQAAKLEVKADKSVAVAANTDTVTYTVTATDVNGVPVESTATVNATFETGDDFAELTVNGSALTNTKSASVTLVDGVGTFTVKAAKKVGAVKVNFADNAALLAGTSQSVSFKAGEAKHIKLDRTAAIDLAVASPEVALTAQLYDASGNIAAEAGHKLNISSANTGVKINGVDNNETLVTDASGKVSFTASLPSYVTEQATITVADGEGSELSAKTAGDNTVTATVVNSVAANMTYTLTTGTTAGGAPVSIATAGEDLFLSVTVKDAGGRTITNEALTVEVTEGATVSTVSLAHAGNGVYSGTFKAKTAGRVSLSVKNTVGAQAISLPIAINARAAAFAGVRVQRADFETAALTTTKGVATAFRIVPVDQYGNFAPKTDAGNVTVTWTAPTLAAGEYFEVRSSETGAAMSSIVLTPGSAGTTFFILTNDASGTWTLSGTNVLDGALTVTAK